MTAQENKAAIWRWIEDGGNCRNEDVADEIFSTEFRAKGFGRDLYASTNLRIDKSCVSNY
jgi:hypothetical protein